MNPIADFVLEDGTIVSDPQEQANMLLLQYDSVTSEPRKEFAVTNADEFFMEEEEMKETNSEVMPELAESEPETDDDDLEDNDEEIEFLNPQDQTSCSECNDRQVHECSEDLHIGQDSQELEESQQEFHLQQVLHLQQELHLQHELHLQQ